MYITRNNIEINKFDWNEYFNNNLKESLPDEITSKLDFNQFFYNVRNILREDAYVMSFTLSKVIKKLLNYKEFESNPRILELGAGTGFLTRLLLTLYGGTGVLVDNCKGSFEAYNKVQDEINEKITYVLHDIFTVNFMEKFDVVCSFGLIEHFKDKNKVLSVHKRFLNENGLLIIIVPLDTRLSRIFFESHPEINLGYRELLTKNEVLEELKACNLDPIDNEVSSGYAYDFIAVLCR